MPKYIRGVRILKKKIKTTQWKMWDILVDYALGLSRKDIVFRNGVKYNTVAKIIHRHSKKRQTIAISMAHPDQLDLFKNLLEDK